MAKTLCNLVAFNDYVRESGVRVGDFEKTTLKKTDIKNILRVLKFVDDMRVSYLVQHKAVTIIFIVMMGKLAGKTKWVEIAEFAENNKDWFGQIVPLYDERVPGVDTIRRFFQRLDAPQLESVLLHFMELTMDAIFEIFGENTEYKRQIAIDGKEMRGSGKITRNGVIKNLQILNGFDLSTGICIFSIPISRKTNEVPVARKKIVEMRLNNCVVSMDAIHANKRTLTAIHKQGGDFVVGLKGNNKTIFESIDEHFTPEYLAELNAKNGREFALTTIDKDNSKTWVRRYVIETDIQWIDNIKSWTNSQSILRCHTTTEAHTSGKKTTEVRYYLTSLTNVKETVHAVRSHWLIENRLHHILDRTFNEDENQTSNHNAVLAMSIVNKFALFYCELLSPFMKKKITSIESVCSTISDNPIGKDLILFLMDPHGLKTLFIDENGEVLKVPA